MGVVPGFLLRHRVAVEPYLGVWGQYGPAVTMRCLVSRKIRASVTAAGVARFVVYTIVARPGERCPDGSRITLDDGTRGYAESAVTHDSGGLGAPDHLEIAMVVGSGGFGAPLGGEQVVILRRIASGQDRRHNDRYTTVEVPVDGCAVRPLASQERATGSRDQTVDTIEVTLPPDTDVERNDRLRVRGLVYDVDGTPEQVKDPMTGARPGVRVIGKRVTG